HFWTQQSNPSSRFARWALTLSQYSYTIEYRKTTAHGNVGALSRLTKEQDQEFDGEKSSDKEDQVCMLRTIGL
ncbi:hypothetical protein CAPTEDRAFT_147159, partial [Capitella teleta]